MAKIIRIGLVGLAFAVFVSVVIGGTLWAQVTASISGKVEDATGAAVGGASVTVKNPETGATRIVTTDEAGFYRVLSLPVGQQEVRAEKPGFPPLCARASRLSSDRKRLSISSWMSDKWRRRSPSPLKVR